MLHSQQSKELRLCPTEQEGTLFYQGWSLALALGVFLSRELLLSLLPNL
jgi:hypothetical protein